MYVINLQNYVNNLFIILPEEGPCPPGIPQVRCISNPCDNARCRAYPDARCEGYFCGGCYTKWFDRNREVDCGGPRVGKNDSSEKIRLH